MSVTVVTELGCDGCGHRYPTSLPGRNGRQHELRAEARTEGWRCDGRGDYCPLCLSLMGAS